MVTGGGQHELTDVGFGGGEEHQTKQRRHFGRGRSIVDRKNEWARVDSGNNLAQVFFRREVGLVCLVPWASYLTKKWCLVVAWKLDDFCLAKQV